MGVICDAVNATTLLDPSVPLTSVLICPDVSPIFTSDDRSTALVLLTTISFDKTCGTESICKGSTRAVSTTSSP